jgi:hypothetical protein
MSNRKTKIKMEKNRLGKKTKQKGGRDGGRE